MIYTTFKDWILNHKNGDLLRCHECKWMTDTTFAFYEDQKNGKCICIDCVERHKKRGDTGIYPVETGQGYVSDSVLLFDDWSVFFDSGDHRKYRWNIVELRSGKLWMQEIHKDGWSTRRYQLIATEEMRRDFESIVQDW